MLAIVLYPSLAVADRQWIASIRSRCDPQVQRIDAHFTLVFPIDVPANEMSLEAATVASSSRPFDFTIRAATAVRDVVGGGGHVFLLPDEGRDEIIKLHDRLYAGPLAPHLRMDLPFTPHLTVAARNDQQWCETLARELNAEQRVLSGTLGSIDLVRVEGARVDSLGAFVLG